MTTIDIEFLDAEGCLCKCAYPLGGDKDQMLKGLAIGALINAQNPEMPDQTIEKSLKNFKEEWKPFYLYTLDDGLPVYGLIVAVDGEPV